MDPTLEGFITLFRGRGDVYGHEEGRCVKAPLTNETFSSHLHGDEYIGTYPMVPHNNGYSVVWGCCDIDYESYEDAHRIQQALDTVGVTAWIERSRSKGYHVWVFATGPVPAKDMRRMLLLAHQVADVPAREVNPKQETLGRGQYGNYVRLPYPSNHVSTLRRVVLKNEQEHYELQEFVERALNQRTSTELIAQIASMWKEPERTTATVIYETAPSVKEALANLSPLGKVIWRDGPLEGRDRSSTLTKLGHECVRSGLDPSCTKVIVTDADLRWGKYHMRPNGEYEIDKLVVRVFS